MLEKIANRTKIRRSRDLPQRKVIVAKGMIKPKASESRHKVKLKQTRGPHDLFHLPPEVNQWKGCSGSAVSNAADLQCCSPLDLATPQTFKTSFANENFGPPSAAHLLLEHLVGRVTLGPPCID